jgi:hypothetical protein
MQILLKKSLKEGRTTPVLVLLKMINWKSKYEKISWVGSYGKESESTDKKKKIRLKIEIDWFTIIIN